MIYTRIDHHLFRYALVSAELGSFRRAALELNTQQSTVSRGVRSLEDCVGTELFKRTYGGIRPTPAGIQFLQEATLGFRHMNRALERAKAVQRGEDGALTVGVSLPLNLLIAHFARFRKDHNCISVEIVESTASANCLSVRQRVVDVAFVINADRHKVLQALHLGDERIVAVLPKSHSAAGARSLSLKDLENENFILCASSTGPELHNYLEKRMARRGLKLRAQLHPVSECNLIDMVALGLGITIGIGRQLGTATDGVVIVPLAGKNVLPLNAVWLESNPNPALKRLLAILQRNVRADPPNEKRNFSSTR